MKAENLLATELVPTLDHMEPNLRDRPATEQAPTTSWERLSWTEICARYPDEWAFLVHVEYENGDMDNGEIIRAVVLGHSKNRAENYRAVKPILEREDIRMASHLYTGELIPKGLLLPPRFL